MPMGTRKTTKVGGLSRHMGLQCYSNVALLSREWSCSLVHGGTMPLKFPALVRGQRGRKAIDASPEYRTSGLVA